MSVLRKMGEWISPSDPDLVEKTLARLNEQDKWNDVFSTKLIELLDNIDKIKSETRKCLRDVTERLQEAESATQAESLLLDKAKEFGDASQRLEFAHTAQKCARALAEEAKTTFESASATLADAQRNEEIARRDAEAANAQLLLAREAEERAMRLSSVVVCFATIAVAFSWIAAGWVGWLTMRTEPALWAACFWTILLLAVAGLILRGAKRDA
jgi:isoleucyl-tRNA synthetase